MSHDPTDVAPVAAGARPPTLRRPPAAPVTGAQVTRIGADPTSAVQRIPVAQVQGALALDLLGSAGMPDTPELSVVRDTDRRHDEVQAWAARFAQAVVEVLGGDRPLTQLVRWTSVRVYADLGRRVQVLGRSTVGAQRLRTVRPQVRSVHVYQPTPDAAEISVHVRYGRRSRALAARLELSRGRWTCTALQLG
jgi:hypothetical protein